MKHLPLHNLLFSLAICLPLLAMGAEENNTTGETFPRPHAEEAVGRRPGHPERENRENRMHSRERERRNPGQFIRKILEELKEKNPAEYQRLQELRQTDSKKFFQEMRQYMPRRVPREFQQILQKEDECRKLAEEIRQMPEGPERQKLVEELKQKLREQYDETIQKMEQRLAQMQSNLSELKERKEDLLRRKFEKLLNGDSGKKAHKNTDNKKERPPKEISNP